jgi:hypothetical protein
VICVYCDGLLKPAGVPTLRTEVPVASGWNEVVLLESPPLKRMGLVVMVPTPVLELVTGTLIAPRPGLTCRDEP